MNSKADAIDAPYPGLRPFDRHESAIFFGRGSHTATMLRLIKRKHFLAVVGSSGCGKSSLVRAGLLPAVKDGYLNGETNWKFIVVRPGDVLSTGVDPFANLAAALVSSVQPDVEKSDSADETQAYREATLRLGPNGLLDAVKDSLAGDDSAHVFVLVDQFEEIFRYRDESLSSDQKRQQQNDAVAFVDMLLSTAKAKDPRIVVSLTMRSDFLGDCDAFYNLPQAINAAQFLPPRLTRDELREVIELPLKVERFRGTIKPEVTAELLNAISDSQDLLPLLQHVLRRMWTMATPSTKSDSSAPRQITLDHYHRSGGLEDALNRHASQIYKNELTEKQRAICQRMFRCLSQPGGEGRQVRRVTTVGKVAQVSGTSAREVSEVIKPFIAPGCSFLSVTGASVDHDVLPEDSRLDISHESLIRQWDDLRTWSRDEEDAAELLQRLIQSERLFSAGRGEHLNAREVNTYDQWNERNKPNAGWATRYCDATEFKTATEFLEASREDVKKTEQAEEIRRQRELKKARQFAAVVGSVALLAIVLAVFAWWQYVDATRARDEARTAQDTAEKSATEAEQERGHALEQVGNASWQRAVTARDYELDSVRASLLFAESAKAFKAAELSGPFTSALIAAVPGARRTFPHDSDVRGALFSGDESRVLTWSEDGTARLWAISTFDNRSVEQFVLETEVRNAAEIADNGSFRLLSFDQWMQKRRELEASTLEVR